MFNVLRKFRRGLLDDGRFGRYLAYAAGEILLVVIGILLALQINDWNDARKDRALELSYLRNIRADVITNIAEIDLYLATRDKGIAGAQRILSHFAGKPIEDLSALAADMISIYDWKRFYLSDNTYQELIGSGNFALLTNPDIKDGLLDIEAQYRKLKGQEDHFRFDSETLLYKPVYKTMYVDPLVQDYSFRMSKGQVGRSGALKRKDFDPWLQSLEARNGFAMTILEFDMMNGQMRAMRDRSRSLVADIDAELRR